MGEFSGRIVLVTGAASGIGRATALAFARAGAALVLGVRDPAGEDAAAAARGAGAAAMFIAGDVAEPDYAARLVQATLDRFGRLDHAVNNAGIARFAEDWDEAAMLRVLAVNLHGVMFGMKRQIAAMLAQPGGGTIVNTASVAGLSAAGTADYVASKHGVVGLTRAAGVRYAAQGVRINAVCPGLIDTAMTAELLGNPDWAPRLGAMSPLGRPGRAEEVAEAVLFLSSPRSSFIVAHALAVDGGYMAR